MSTLTIYEKREYINSYDFQSKMRELLIMPNIADEVDDDRFNPWYDHKQALRGSINRFDAMGIQLMSLMYEDVFTKDKPPTQQTKIFMQKFIENSVGNNQLNNFLNQSTVKNQIDYSDYITEPIAVHNTAYFAFKTRNITSTEKFINKLRNVHEAMHFNLPVNDNNKLFLKELGLASDLAKLLPILTELNKFGFLEGNKKLEQMYENAIIAKDIMNYFTQENTQDFKKIGHGILILDDSRRAEDVLRIKLSPVDKLFTLFSKYGHASMIHFDQAGDVQKSNILYDGFSQSNFAFTNQLYANSYKIDPIALIPKEKHQLLAAVYGKDWQVEIVSKFKIIDNQIHTNAYDKFGDLSASGAKDQQISGLSNLIPFGHKQLKANDFNELHQKVMSGEYAKQKNYTMLCSEFCAVTMIASFVELDKQIKQDMTNSKAVKQTGIDLNKESIVNVPFGKHEDLHKMHPDRLFKALKNHNCVEPVVNKLDDYLQKDTKSITNKIRSKMKNISLYENFTKLKSIPTPTPKRSNNKQGRSRS